MKLTIEAIKRAINETKTGRDAARASLNRKNRVNAFGSEMVEYEDWLQDKYGPYLDELDVGWSDGDGRDEKGWMVLDEIEGRFVHSGVTEKGPIGKMKAWDAVNGEDERKHKAGQKAMQMMAHKKITLSRLRKIIREESKSTKKYDDDSALKGKQDKLPDALQKGIIDKAVEDRDEDEKKDETFRRLKSIIREVATDEMLDHDHPSDVSTQEEVWSGGQNIHWMVDHAHELHDAEETVTEPEILSICELKNLVRRMLVIREHSLLAEGWLTGALKGLFRGGGVGNIGADAHTGAVLSKLENKLSDIEKRLSRLEGRG